MRGGRRSLRLSERRSRPGIFAFRNGRLLLLQIGVQKPDQRFLLRRVQKSRISDVIESASGDSSPIR